MDQKKTCEICNRLYKIPPLEYPTYVPNTSSFRVRIRESNKTTIFKGDICPNCARELLWKIKTMKRNAPKKCDFCEFDRGPLHEHPQPECKDCVEYSNAWFDYEVQKMCSIAASMATMAFNKYFKEEYREWFEDNYEFKDVDTLDEKTKRLFVTYKKACEKGAMFDARVFNIPKEEVVNCIYWRQLDAARNSVQMVGQANFSHNELHGKTCNMIQDMLFEQKCINWNDYNTRWKRGVCWTKEKGIDYNMPMLRGDDRKYLEDLVNYVEEE